ncbi:MAG: nicotinate-nucleotide adenylyltransferase [Gammaproteobacteria bacterium]
MTVSNSSPSPLRPIGILGGTFDPIHLGHLYLATEVYQRLHLQEVRLIPCSQSALKNKPIASSQQRLKLVKLACQGHPGLIVDDREIRRKGVSYTYDTLVELRQELGKTPICLLMATDVFAKFTEWHRWQEITSLAHLVVVKRRGFTIENNPVLTQLIHEREIHRIEQLSEAPSGYILYVDFPQSPISATEIRQKIATHQTVHHLMPEAVWEYIKKEKLYLNSPGYRIFNP